MSEVIVLKKEELEDIIKKAVKEALDEHKAKEKDSSAADDIVYGVKGIADFLGISESTCGRYIRAKTFKDAIFHVGRQVRGYASKLRKIFEEQDPTKRFSHIYG